MHIEQKPPSRVALFLCLIDNFGVRVSLIEELLVVIKIVKEKEMGRKVKHIDPLVYFCGLLGTDKEGIVALAKEVLSGAEDGELYFGREENDFLSLDEERIDAPSSATEQGFGVRRVNGKTVLYASGNTIAQDTIRTAAKELHELSSVSDTYEKCAHELPTSTYYDQDISAPSIVYRAALLKRIDRYARKDSSVLNVTTSINCSMVYTLIVRADGHIVADIRPMARLNVTVLCASGEKIDSTGNSIGGRYDYANVSSEREWKALVDLVILQTKDKLRAVPCPSGAMTVVLGSGWAGVLLHEAIGHGLEADHVWTDTSVFAHMLGERVASPLVNVVDDGTIRFARGSLNADDEGTPTKRTVLIKDGILVGFMHDRQSARLLGLPETGSGRRESFAHPPQVRMRNTLMCSGDSEPEDIISSTFEGLYMPSFGGGQVDPVTGQFVFKCDLAYKIVAGKIGDPVVGPTLIGNCTTVLLGVDMVGNDSCLGGAGTCGKGGQSVPVGIGQPTIRISSGLTVGGTE